MTQKRILVIDDDEIFRTGLVGILQMEGYSVLEAKDGEEGLAVFKEENPDLVITDILMPKKEGIETIIEILDEQSGQAIIAMSGGGKGNPREYLGFAENFGARQILQKPFRIPELLAAIESLMNGSADA